jgi:hypothetical protein
MNDVVSQLRDYASVATHSAMGLCNEAADEMERLTNEIFNLNQKLEEKSVLCNHMANTLREISKHSFGQLHVYINALNAYKAVFDDPSM